MCDYYGYNYLAPFISDALNLYELNALSRKLADLNPAQQTAFAGLLKMEIEKRDGDILVPKLIDLAYSVDYCHVVAEALNDSQLGRFYADNGFIPITENVPDSVYELLDFEALGRKARNEEGGVFVERDAYGCCGYVVRHTDLVEAYKDMDLTPKKPPYTVLLELTKGWFHDPAYDSEKTVQLWFPSSPAAMDHALNELEAATWAEVSFQCIDCRVPALMDVVSSANNVAEVNRFSQWLDNIPQEKLAGYKALLAATQCRDLQNAMMLMDALDSYIFTPSFSSPVDVARGELKVTMAESDAEILLPHVNLYTYGEALLQSQHAILTEYGVIERQDGQPILTQQFQEMGAAYDVPRHLWHFNPHTMRLVAQQHGFKLVATHPMPFDGFYISMLSEKNKGASFPFVRGLWQGFKALSKASCNKEKSSSVIYVFEKLS